MSYKFKGVYIPANVWLDERLSPIQKMLLCEIDAMNDGIKEPCFAGNKHFAIHLQCSVGSIKNMLTKLEKLGYISRSYEDVKLRHGRRMWTNLSNIIQNDTPSSENDTPSSENDTPSSENDTPSSENDTINKPLNSLINKPLKTTLLESSKKRDLISFKKEFIDNYIVGHTFKTISLGWLPDTNFKLDENNYIFNTVSNKMLTKDDSFKVWKYLFEQSKL